MPTGADELRRRLLESDEEFRQLAAQHQDLDEQLNRLARKSYLTQSEQFEEMTLKKRKLHVKDRMEAILRRYRQAEPDVPVSGASRSVPGR